jgi:hypothetical protein
MVRRSGEIVAAELVAYRHGRLRRRRLGVALICCKRAYGGDVGACPEGCSLNAGERFHWMSSSRNANRFGQAGRFVGGEHGALARRFMSRACAPSRRGRGRGRAASRYSSRYRMDRNSNGNISSFGTPAVITRSKFHLPIKNRLRQFRCDNVEHDYYANEKKKQNWQWVESKYLTK